jgi:hypothetical protein
MKSTERRERERKREMENKKFLKKDKNNRK